MELRADARRNQAGQSVVELAFVLPLLILFILGVADLSRAIHAYSAIVNLSREGANLAARTTMDAATIMNTLAAGALPLALDKQGMMYLTEVEEVSGSTTIRSQLGWKGGSGLRSRINGHSVADALSGIELEPGQKVLVFEVLYRYDSFFKSGAGGFAPVLHSQTIF
ncbi:MAG: TadE family protein [uncultured bacterium]|uniref:Flp pilus minor pilin TadF n=1 Tax=Citrifermentans bemidjiense (strain ATCC BAA-1014 / DSM 16622 / JCM 12645 / Bem) TaxID=404380 RepID=B5EGL6_CITBB|nr:TadE family protein [Citrifermentans bemidjiense]ACH38081.1 Flp pilus minor pilin TadF [Citrifermentans bemidjiense Bem]EKD59414.1 MAG: TadE family protein [uncultured bacterium]